ncbi:hypothetical protein, partial [Klebsiella aerogenes]|uniref:hypothetical protein n=1 Tax=Klebsiella aerogenes TaxID=548 RepID=UPI000A77250D
CHVVITAGGGGIPVIREGNHLRGASADFTSVSDKARAIGGGVLEALMTLMNKRIKEKSELLSVA